MARSKHSLRIRRQIDSRGRATYRVRQSGSNSELLDRARVNDGNGGDQRNHNEEYKEEREEKKFELRSGRKSDRVPRGDRRPSRSRCRRYRTKSRERAKMVNKRMKLLPESC